jgi:ligand-binding sensor domain-containing protein
MKRMAVALSMMLLLPTGCGLSLQPTATSPTSAPTDTAIPQAPEWTVYNTANSGLPSDTICGLAIDAKGNIWSGCWNGVGLTKFDGEAWTVYDTENPGLPHNGIVRLAIDTQGNVWIGTYGGGLAVCREGGVE